MLIYGQLGMITMGTSNTAKNLGQSGPWPRLESGIVQVRSWSFRCFAGSRTCLLQRGKVIRVKWARRVFSSPTANTV